MGGETLQGLWLGFPAAWDRSLTPLGGFCLLAVLNCSLLPTRYLPVLTQAFRWYCTYLYAPPGSLVHSTVQALLCGKSFVDLYCGMYSRITSWWCCGISQWSFAEMELGKVVKLAIGRGSTAVL